jgi:hypothetical protein
MYYMTDIVECYDLFEKGLTDYPFTMNNIRDINNILDNEIKKKELNPDEAKTLRDEFTKIRCVRTCENDDSDEICRHKKRFYFGSQHPIPTDHCLIYNKNGSFTQIFVNVDNNPDEHEDEFYEKIIALDEKYKNPNPDLASIKEDEIFIKDYYLYFYLKNQTQKYNVQNQDDNPKKTFKSHLKYENLDLNEDYEIFVADDFSKIGLLDEEIIETFKPVYNSLKSNSIIYLSKLDSLALNYQDYFWYKEKDINAKPLESVYIEKMLVNMKKPNNKTKKRFPSLLEFIRGRTSRARSYSTNPVTQGQGKKKLFKKKFNQKKQKNTFRKSVSQNKQKNTSRKSKKKKPKTLKKSVRRKK